MECGARKSQQLAAPEDYAAENTGQSIDFLAKNQRFLVDEDVAQDTSRGARDRTHDDGHPHRESRSEGLLDAHDGKQSQTDGIEDIKRIVEADKVFAQTDNDHHGKGRDDQVVTVQHPERGEVQHDVAHRTATDSRGDSHDISPEPVEAFRRCQPDTADGEGQRTQNFDNRKKSHNPNALQPGIPV